MDEYITVWHIAKSLNVCHKTAYRIVKKSIPHYKVGQQLRINKVDFDNYMASIKEVNIE